MLHLELNLDGLPGPTHGFSGLSRGNLASMRHKAAVSNPRAAFLQGLEKARLVASLGVPQGFLPPHERPLMPLLHRLGYRGTDAQVLQSVWAEDPELLLQACSSSAMWTANAATVCPSADSTDGRLHITPANLASQFHRSLEAGFTAEVLRRLLPGAVHHAALPSHPSLGDEGAANHVRLGLEGRGVQLFIHAPATMTRFPGRQSARASRAVARLNRVATAHFFEQAPPAVDAGAFHNDVVCVGSGDILLMHEQALTLPAAELAAVFPREVRVLAVAGEKLSLEEAVGTYLFNSQLVPVGEEELALIAPVQVRESARAAAAVAELLSAGSRLRHVHYVDLTQSMLNGGGPACLRLRLPLTQQELEGVHAGVLYTPELHDRLTNFANRRFRTELRPGDLADPQMLHESRDALDELSRILRLGRLYGFQGGPAPVRSE